MTHQHLTGRTFYGVILLGLFLGVTLACGGALLYLHSRDPHPEARRIWGDVAEDLVVPIAVMIGATFGSLAGCGVAILLERFSHTSDPGGSRSSQKDPGS